MSNGLFSLSTYCKTLQLLTNEKVVLLSLLDVSTSVTYSNTATSRQLQNNEHVLNNQPSHVNVTFTIKGYLIIRKDV